MQSLFKVIGYRLAHSLMCLRHIGTIPELGYRSLRRLASTMLAPELDKIPRVEKAGELKDGFQRMHNGLQIQEGSLYGIYFTVLLGKTRGVHEPQEEFLFAEMLPRYRADATMVELGAFWGFYSMWFLKGMPQRKAWLMEPEPGNLQSGKINFEVNGLTADFTHAAAGWKRGSWSDGTPVIPVDEFLKEKNIETLDLLHGDIQGAEGGMLRGADESLRAGKIKTAFVSTHSVDLHHECRGLLEAAGMVVEREFTVDESYSGDGLIVARHSSFPALGLSEISRRARRLG